MSEPDELIEWEGRERIKFLPWRLCQCSPKREKPVPLSLSLKDRLLILAWGLVIFAGLVVAMAHAMDLI